MTTLTESFQDLWEPLATEASESLWFSLNNDLWWPDFITKLAKAFVTLQRGEISKADLDFTDDANAFAEQYALKHGGELITNITNDQKKAIQLITSQAFTHGVSDQVVAKRIQKTLGLTDTDATVLNSFRQGLLHRGVPAGSADYQSEQYGDKLRWARAVLIARTEIAKAMNAGQLEAWETGLVTGDLDPETQRRWVLSRLNRHCMRCVGMAGTSIPIAKSYPGGIVHPPLHPNCGCTEELVTPTGFSKFYSMDVRVRISKGRKAEDVEGELRRAAGSGIIGRYHPGEWTKNSLPDRDPNLHLIRRHKVHDRPGQQHLIAVNNHHYYLKKEPYGLWQAIEYDKTGKPDIIVRAPAARGQTVAARSHPVRVKLDTWIGQNPTKYDDRIPPPGGWPKVREAEATGQYFQGEEDRIFREKNPEKVKEEPFKMNPRNPVPWSWYWIHPMDENGKPLAPIKIITSYRPGDYRLKPFLASREETRKRNRLERAAVAEKEKDAKLWNRAVNLDQDKEAFNAALKKEPVPDEEVSEALPLQHIDFLDSKDRYPGWEVWKSKYDKNERYYVKKFKRSTENGVDVFWGAFQKPENTDKNFIGERQTHEEVLQELDDFVGPGMTAEEKQAAQEARQASLKAKESGLPLASHEEAKTQDELDAERAAKIARRHESKAQRVVREASEALDKKNRALAHAHELAEESRVRVLKPTPHGHLGLTDTSARSISGRPAGYKPRAKKTVGERAAAAVSRRGAAKPKPLGWDRAEWSAKMDINDTKAPARGKVPNGFHKVKDSVRAPNTQARIDRAAVPSKKWPKGSLSNPDPELLKGPWTNDDSERKLVGIPPAHSNVVLIDNVDDHLKKQDVKVLGWGWDEGAFDQKTGLRDPSTAKRVPYTSVRFKEQGVENKFQRVLAFRKHVKPLMDSLKRDAPKNDAAACVDLILRTGMRPGSKPTGSGRVASFGACSLLRGQVHSDPIDKEGTKHAGAVLFDFTGKSAVHQYQIVDDPEIYSLIKSRLARPGKPDDPLWTPTGARGYRGKPMTMYQETLAWYHNEGGCPSPLKLKDMRTNVGSAMAADLVSKLPQSEYPMSLSQFNKVRKEIAEKVCAQLGNQATMAIKSYISPHAFDPIASGTNWAEIKDGKVTVVADAIGTPDWMSK